MNRLAYLLFLLQIGIAQSTPQFVGSRGCADCHPKQALAWKDSDHDLAMQEPNAATVLGNFAGANFSKGGLTTTFRKQGDKFVIRTDGPDGKLADFDVKYVFGVRPLQQYLLQIPGGRLQAFTIAWDSRPKAGGGQRWFDLYPTERLKPGDELHWTGLQQNWNTMCADCHSTNLVKGYDPGKEVFNTTWSQLNVGCEACHGPGSDHARWARAGASTEREPGKGLTVQLDERKDAAWIPASATGIAVRNRPRATGREIEVCAQCHSRRSQLAGSYHAGRALFDHYMPALLSEGLYEVDGQQKDEVYNWGSFLQSRMHAKGVTCSDCHDPHTAKIRAPGNSLCANCHMPDRFDNPKHHFHQPGSSAAQCTACHMPTRTYMGVDARHDHSFSLPRPDFSEKTGTPNVCTGCHTGKANKWATDAIAKVHGQNRRNETHYGSAFDAARKMQAGTRQRLLDVVKAPGTPGIVRASALADFPDFASRAAAEALVRSAGDPDPLVRVSAARAAGRVPPRERLSLLGPMLTDTVLAVRIEAANQMAGIPRQHFQSGTSAAFDRALGEYREVQLYNADRPEAWMNLGSLEANLGNLDEAQRALERAIRIAPTFIPARVNLADLWRSRDRNDLAEKTLRDALQVAPSSAEARHALGLALVRQGKMAPAVAELGRAAKLSPRSARYAYVHAVALHGAGQQSRALQVLESAQKRHTGDREILQALVSYSMQAGKQDAAQAWGQKLKELDR